MAKILFIDDEIKLLELVAEVLEAIGHDVTTLTNPLDALLFIKNENFDLIITDHIMPQMNGMELITLLREKGSEIPIILSTGHPLEQSDLIGLAGDRVHIINKPYKRRVLQEAIDEILK